MKCPSCGNPDAYQGLTSIDCPNSNCRHNSSKSTVVTTMPAPPAPPNNPILNNPFPNPGTPGNTNPGNGTVTSLSVTILSRTAKINSVMITFKAAGDPGFPNKSVEFQFTTPHNPIPQVCELSNAAQYYVGGVDADNQTVYTTHWMSTNDGVRPTDPYTLTASIH